MLRLRGDYLAIVTLAFGEIIRLVLINWVDVTNGGAGISGDPEGDASSACRSTRRRRRLRGRRSGSTSSRILQDIFLYYLILLLALLTAFVTMRLRRLPVGRAWEALREDEIACRSLGINTTTTKLTAFAIGAMFGGFAGSFFAARQGFVSPRSSSSWNWRSSSPSSCSAAWARVGVAIAAIVMIGGTEILRELDFLKQVFGESFDPTQYRMLLFGLAMVADHAVEAARLRLGSASRPLPEGAKIGLGRLHQGRARLMSASAPTDDPILRSSI